MPIKLPDDSIGTGEIPEGTSLAYETTSFQDAPKNHGGFEPEFRKRPFEIKYEAEMDACQAAYEDPAGGVSIQCRDEAAALALRMRFYRFRKDFRKLFPDTYNAFYDRLAFTAKGDQLHIRKTREWNEGYQLKSLGDC